MGPVGSPLRWPHLGGLESPGVSGICECTAPPSPCGSVSWEMSREDRSLKSRLGRPRGSGLRAFAGAASGLLESPRLKSVHTKQTLSWGTGGPDEDKGLRAVRGLQGPPGGLPAGPGLAPLDADAPASRSAEREFRNGDLEAGDPFSSKLGTPARNCSSLGAAVGIKETTSEKHLCH